MVSVGGAVQQTYEYDAYGIPLTDPCGVVNPFPSTALRASRYVGQLGYYKDRDHRMMLLGARYYDPYIGRFITQDPIGYAGGTNLYRYGGDNPATYVDPWGFSPVIRLPCGPSGPPPGAYSRCPTRRLRRLTPRAPDRTIATRPLLTSRACALVIKMPNIAGAQRATAFFISVSYGTGFRTTPGTGRRMPFTQGFLRACIRSQNQSSCSGLPFSYPATLAPIAGG
jgi:RHS repeat-associated protein